MAGRALITTVIILSMPLHAHAENAMGYRAVTTEEAAGLPARYGSLGMSVEASRQVSDSGMTFELIRIKQVRAGLPARRAGVHSGDQIIAVDSRVFPNAQRGAVVHGQGAQPGMSTGEKVAVGVGAAALPGCHEMGCFAARHDASPSAESRPVKC